MTILPPDTMKNFVEEETAHHGYPSADAYVQALVYQAQKRRARKDLEAKLLEGLESPIVPMDENFWDSVRKQALEGLDGGNIRP